MCDFFKSLGLHKVGDTFDNKRIDGTLFLELNEQDIIDENEGLGIVDIATQNLLLDMITSLRKATGYDESDEY